MISRGKPTGPAPILLKWGFYNQKQLLMSHQKLLLIKNIIFLIKGPVGDGKSSPNNHFPKTKDNPTRINV